MTTGINETAAARTPRSPSPADQIETFKGELMKAEVRLAKARATVVSAEIDIRVVSARLKAAAR